MIKLDLPTVGEIRHLFKEGILTSIKYSDNALLTIETHANNLEAVNKKEIKKGCFYRNPIWLKDGNIAFSDTDGIIEFDNVDPKSLVLSIMPVIRDKELYYELTENVNGNSLFYYDYSLFAVKDIELQKELEREYLNKNIIKTNKVYNYGKHSYFYKGKTYVRIIVKSNNPSVKNHNYVELSNGEVYEENEYVWLEVTPLEWLIDRKKKILICKYPIIGGSYYRDNDKFPKCGVSFCVRELGRNMEHNLIVDFKVQALMDEYNKEKINDMVSSDISIQMLMNKQNLSLEDLQIDGESKLVLRRQQ